MVPLTRTWKVLKRGAFSKWLSKIFGNFVVFVLTLILVPPLHTSEIFSALLSSDKSIYLYLRRC